MTDTVISSATKEVVSPEEMQKRWTKMLEGGKVE